MTPYEIFTTFVIEPSIIIGNLCFASALAVSVLPKKWKKRLFSLAEFAFLFLTLSLLTFLLPLMGMQIAISFYVKYFIVAALYLTYIGIKFRKIRKSLCIIFCSLYAMTFLLGELGGSIPILVQQLESSKILDSIIRNVCTFLIVPFAYIINRYPFSKIRFIPFSVYFFTAFFNLFILVISWYSSFHLQIREFNFAMFELIIFLFLVISDVFAYLMLFNQCRKNQEKMDLIIKNDELEKNEQLMMISDQNLEKLRMLKHDCKNQYATMKLLLEQRKYDELDQFFMEYGDGIIEPVSFISVNNKVISSILNMEYSKALAQSIHFDCKLAIPDHLDIYSTDLTSLLCNLLDNAIEATVLTEKEKRIYIRMRVYQEFLYIEIANPIRSGLSLDDIKKVRTTKNNFEQHGFGRKVISSTVRKYNGTIHDEINEDGMYHVTIMLSMPNEKGEEE